MRGFRNPGKMPMFRAARLAALALVFAALPAAAQEDYPFVGEWDCEVATFVITNDVYNNGSEDMAILEVQEGTDGSWTLFFEGDYFFTVGDITPDSMSWLSGESGDAFSCRKVN
jgi:hypothetical protein